MTPHRDAALGGSPARTDAGANEVRSLRKRAKVARLVDQLIAGIAVLVLWQVAAQIGTNKRWISSPIEVAERAWDMAVDGTLQMHTWQTLQEALLGLLLGMLIGTVIGLVLGHWRRLSDALDPVIMGLYSLPRVSLAPLFIIWLGIGMAAKVALVVSLVGFVALYNVREGLKSIDGELVDAFRSMNASRIAMLRYVIAPSLVPWLLTAMRICIGMALIGAVVGEMIGASRGLGWYVSHATNVYDITGSITALFVLGILAMILNALLGLVEARLLSWRKDARIEQV
jgi:NitT/TauT family transport system permease protein